MDASFDRSGPAAPASPVVLSVPHAGRDYPLALRAALRVPLSGLLPLEDRHVDRVAIEARTAEIMLVQRLPRAWIDLNRGEHERDPRVDEGVSAATQPVQSAKLRSGLGLVPRRASGAGEIWRRRFPDADIRRRIEHDHRPYHQALADALAAAHAIFGVAILVDLHSMPPIDGGARIVIGDRFGRSSATRFVARVEAECNAGGIRCALNAPYAGGHILDRHARPAAGIHAIQLELDRSLYLDAGLHEPGAGLVQTVALLRRILAAIADEALAQPLAIAAE
ncbi:MAG TPA: N-formylglutamate amidohydrolase [Sphingomonas sp.]|jgi:N-formylglutamate amidohydrolase|nr:N-formylglutamate amidohydrolase [Sphingomonas sp.]